METQIANPHASLPPSVLETAPVKPERKKTPHPKPAHMRGDVPIITGDLIGLPGLKTDGPPQVGDFSIVIQATQAETDACPYCGCASELFHPSNGTRTKKKQRLFDEPRGFRRALIEITRRNFKCEGCDASGLLPLWGVGERHRLTDRLVRYVEHVSLLRPFAEVALTTGLSERKVRQVFDGHVRHLKKTVVFELPRVIGLDGITIRKKGRFVVITDVERSLVLHVWNYSRGSEKDDPQAAARALVKLLMEMEGAEQIEHVIIDMSKQFRSVVEQALPQAKIVIDRFHIQRTANDAMDNVRIRLHKKLKQENSEAKMCYASMLRKRWTKLKKPQREYLKVWFKKHPILRRAYFAKETFCRMWNAGSAAEAKRYYEKWLRRFAVTVLETSEQAEMREDFKDILSPMEGWGTYIFNYFDLDRKMTNAFTEWTNRRIRDVRRESPGCSVPVMRAKVIFGTWLRQRLKAGKKMWGEKMVLPKRTRRPSARKKGVGSQKLKPTRKSPTPRRASAAQLSLLEE